MRKPKRKPDIIMAVDESINDTGVAIFYGNQLRQVYRIRNDRKLPVEQRYHHTATEFARIIKKHKPTVFLLEDIYEGNSILSFRYNLFLQGIVYGMGYLKAGKRFLFQTYYPNTWRKIVGISTVGKREELKQRDCEFVRRKFGLVCDDNTADAICIGLAYITEFSKDDA